MSSLTEQLKLRVQELRRKETRGIISRKEVMWVGGVEIATKSPEGEFIDNLLCEAFRQSNEKSESIWQTLDEFGCYYLGMTERSGLVVGHSGGLLGFWGEKEMDDGGQNRRADLRIVRPGQRGGSVLLLGSEEPQGEKFDELFWAEKGWILPQGGVVLKVGIDGSFTQKENSFEARSGMGAIYVLKSRGDFYLWGFSAGIRVKSPQGAHMRTSICHAPGNSTIGYELSLSGESGGSVPILPTSFFGEAPRVSWGSSEPKVGLRYEVPLAGQRKVVATMEMPRVIGREAALYTFMQGKYPFPDEALKLEITTGGRVQTS